MNWRLVFGAIELQDGQISASWARFVFDYAARFLCGEWTSEMPKPLAHWLGTRFRAVAEEDEDPAKKATEAFVQIFKRRRGRPKRDMTEQVIEAFAYQKYRKRFAREIALEKTAEECQSTVDQVSDSWTLFRPHFDKKRHQLALDLTDLQERKKKR